MLEYVSGLWQTFYTDLIFGSFEYHSGHCLCHMGTCVDGFKMVFYPIKFWGFHLGTLPVGWQGIVPRKAGRISGIITDNTLSKLGSLREF